MAGVAAASAPSVAGQDVGRIPQTTVGMPPGGPPIRYATRSQQLAYTVTGQAFGANITQPLVAVAGFLTALIVKIGTSGFTSTAAVVATADSPWNIIASLTLRDASGQPIYPAVDGFGLFLINLYSGMTGDGGGQDPRTLPSFSAVQLTSGAGAGGFVIKLWLPLEANSSAYCALPADNSAELPKLFITLNSSAALYTTPPSTLGTMNVTVEEEFLAVPNNYPNWVPFDAGASHQWMLTTSGNNPPNAAAQRVQDQGVGQFVCTKIYVLRDGNNVRQDSFPTSDLTWWIDNYPYLFELSDDRFDKMAKQFGTGQVGFTGLTRPAGVIAFTRRTSLSGGLGAVLLADDLEAALVTTGSTKIEVGGTWGTLSAQPASLTAYTGMVFPGPTGWPYGSQVFGLS